MTVNLLRTKRLDIIMVTQFKEILALSNKSRLIFFSTFNLCSLVFDPQILEFPSDFLLSVYEQTPALKGDFAEFCFPN